MLIITKASIDRLVSAVVNETHGIVDQDGKRVTFGTLDHKQLRIAALNAISTAVNEVVWPQDQKIDMPKPVERDGPFAKSA
jgi:hypothetical protein